MRRSRDITGSVAAAERIKRRVLQKALRPPQYLVRYGSGQASRTRVHSRSKPARPHNAEARVAQEFEILGYRPRCGRPARLPATAAVTTVAAVGDDEVMDAGMVDLLPGERILWEGRPVRHRLFRSTDALLVPLSILWCGFALFWEGSVLAALVLSDGGPPIFFALWGVPFVLVGLYLVVGRFVVRAVASRRTRYVLTDRRAVVMGGWSGTRTTAEYLRSLPPPVIAEGSDGSGSLAFGSFPTVGQAFSARSGWRAWAAEPGSTPVFRDVPHVRGVRDLVANAQMGSDPAART